MKQFITSIPVILLLNLTYAQTVEPAKNVEQHILQFEIETSYSIENNSHTKIESFSIPSVLVRYGLNNSIELQVSVPIIKENHFADDKLIHTNHLINDMQLGLQYSLRDEANGLPQTSFMVRTVIPPSNISFSKLSYITALNFANNITHNLSLNYNLGLLFGNQEPTTSYYILNATYSTKKLHYFIENTSNFIVNHKPLHNLSFGFGIDFNSNFTVDFSSTSGINHDLFALGAIFIYNFKI